MFIKYQHVKDMFDVLILKDIIFNEYKLLYGKRFLNGGIFRKSTLQQLLEWHKTYCVCPYCSKQNCC